MVAKLAALVAVSLLTGAAAPNVPWNAFNRQWGTKFEDVAIGVAVDPSGVYVVGHTRGTLPGQISAGNFDPYVRRYDAGGNEVWTRQFGATDYASFDLAGGVATVPGAVYVVGTVFGTLPGQTSRGWSDAFIRKYDDDGTELWTQQFGGTQVPLVLPGETANGVAADVTGVYVVGDTTAVLDGQVNAGGADAFISKYDHDGNLLWTRQFGTVEDEAGASVATDPTGIYVVGDTLGTLPGQTKTSSDKEAFVRKYDVNGNEVWTRQFAPGSANIAFPCATTVVTQSGRVYVGGRSAGTMPGSPSAGGFFIRTYDADGNELWTRQGMGAPVFAWRTASLAVDATGLSFVSAAEGTLPGQIAGTGERAFVRRYDLDGNERWTRQFIVGVANSVAADASGIYIAGETSRTLPDQVNAGDTDAFLVKVFETADVDEIPPVVTCLSAPTFFLNVSIFQDAAVSATVSDDGSGPLAATVSVRALTNLPGQQTITLGAMDWSGNVGTASCPYSVVYRFSFSPPTGVPPTVNTAEAGRTIPVRWVVSDAQGRRITDPNHVRGVTVRPVPCGSGGTTNPIDPSLEPPIGLTLLADRSWQYGWETDKSYKNKDACQELTVHLADEVSGRIVLFEFDKDKKDKEN